MNSQRLAKVETIQEIKERLASCRSVIFADYKGLNVTRVNMLRRRCRDAGVEMRVSKNTLTRIAVSEVGLEGAVPFLTEQTAAFYSQDDPVAPAKILDTFFKEYRMALQLRGGVVEGKVVDASAVSALIDLPSKDILLGQLLGTLNAPIVGLLNVVQGNTRNLVSVLEAIRKQKAGE